MKRQQTRPALRRHVRRCGMTLYEIVFVMSAAALIAAATIPTLTRLVRADRAAMAETMTYRALDRLAHQFREDVRRAESVIADDGLVLTIADTQVTYYIDNNALRRKTVRSGQTRTDAFALPSDTEFQFAAPPDALSGLARIRVQLPRRARSELDPIYLPLDIEALVGGDLAHRT